MDNDLKLGLALGGGSARAAAHVGAIKVLESYGVRPVILSGTSSGAFVAALYAMGLSAAELEKEICSLKAKEFWLSSMDFAPDQLSFSRGKKLKKYLDKKFFKGAKFKDLQIPLLIASTDLQTGNLFLINKGSLAKAVIASGSLPGIFAASEWRGRWLIDGGFVEPVPFGALADMALDKIYGVHTGVNVNENLFLQFFKNNSHRGSHYFNTIAKMSLPKPLSRLNRAYEIVFASYNNEMKIPKNGVLISCDPKINWWDFHKLPSAVRAGEQAMLEHLRANPINGFGEV